MGELGDGTTNGSSIPVNVEGLTSGVVEVSTGWSHTCGLLNTGGVKCWGEGTYGQLGNGTTNGSSIPVSVQGLSSRAVKISAEVDHTCAVLEAGGVKCWGWGGYGELGNGTTSSSSLPVDVAGLTSGVVGVSAGGDHSCALMSTGVVKCWGYNNGGQLGDGTNTNALVPVNVAGLTTPVAKLSLGYDHTCALLTTGAVKCWGANNAYKSGNPDFSNFPIPVIGFDGLPTSPGVPSGCSVISSNTLRAPIKYTKRKVRSLIQQALDAAVSGRSKRSEGTVKVSFVSRGARAVASMEQTLQGSKRDNFICPTVPVSCTSHPTSKARLIRAFSSLYWGVRPRGLSTIVANSNREISAFKRELRKLPDNYVSCGG